MAGIGEAGMTLIGTAFGLGGKKPVVPPAPHVDPTAAQGESITANIGALPKLEDLASKVDSFNIDELFKQLEKFSPGITKAIGKIPGILSDELSGKVPDDVLKEIQRGVGSKAWQLGLSPGQRTALSAETIGSTSYAIQQQGVTAAERWMAQIESAAPRMDFTKMFITPGQALAADQWNEVMRFNTEWMGNKLAAMPSPLEQAEMGALQAFGSTVDQYGSMALGAMGGGGGSMGSIMGMMGKQGGGGGGNGTSSSSFYQTGSNQGFDSASFDASALA